MRQNKIFAALALAASLACSSCGTTGIKDAQAEIYNLDIVCTGPLNAGLHRKKELLPEELLELLTPAWVDAEDGSGPVLWKPEAVLSRADRKGEEKLNLFDEGMLPRNALQDSIAFQEYLHEMRLGSEWTKPGDYSSLPEDALSKYVEDPDLQKLSYHHPMSGPDSIPDFTGIDAMRDYIASQLAGGARNLVLIYNTAGKAAKPAATTAQIIVAPKQTGKPRTAAIRRKIVYLTSGSPHTDCPGRVDAGISLDEDGVLSCSASPERQSYSYILIVAEDQSFSKVLGSIDAGTDGRISYEDNAELLKKFRIHSTLYFKYEVSCNGQLWYSKVLGPAIISCKAAGECQIMRREMYQGTYE